MLIRYRAGRLTGVVKLSMTFFFEDELNSSQKSERKLQANLFYIIDLLI